MTRARIIVLGSAAGGGFPQWNCRCSVCLLFWQGDQRVRERTQSSLAVTGDGEEWVLFNCSPDIRTQILRTSALQPARAKRHSPIAAVLLTNGDIDHVAGLLCLRESQPFALYVTAATGEALAENRMFTALDEQFVTRHKVDIGERMALPGGLEAELFAVPGKVPLYLEEGEVDIGMETEATVGLKVTYDGGYFFYIPGCATLTPHLRERLSGAALVLFDGTLWTDDEMIREGVGHKTGQRMGHMSMSGPAGSIAGFKELDVRRKIYVHINNTNPVLIDGSPERQKAEQAGWEIAEDNMEIEL